MLSFKWWSLLAEHHFLQSYFNALSWADNHEVYWWINLELYPAHALLDLFMHLDCATVYSIENLQFLLVPRHCRCVLWVSQRKTNADSFNFPFAGWRGVFSDCSELIYISSKDFFYLWAFYSYFSILGNVLKLCSIYRKISLLRTYMPSLQLIFIWI